MSDGIGKEVMKKQQRWDAAVEAHKRFWKVQGEGTLKEIEAIYSAFHNFVRVPEGWQVVPKKATAEMRKAAAATPRMSFINDQLAATQLRAGVVFNELAGEQSALDDAYEAMLAVAPQPQASKT